MERKFKIGDVVIAVHGLALGQQEHLHKIGTVTKVDFSDKIANGNFEDGTHFSLFFYKLEHALVYNSPLYQALL